MPEENPYRMLDDGPAAGLGPAYDVVPLTAGENGDVPTQGYRGLLVASGGTANITTAKGELRDSVPLQTGYNPIRIKALRVGGTATGIWGQI